MKDKVYYDERWYVFFKKIKKWAKSLYYSKPLEEKIERDDKEEKRADFTSSDFIDYDGMGNQGRFPTKDSR